MKILDYILARLGESSTWRGIAFLVSAAGISLRPEDAASIAAAGMAVVGAINVLRKS